MPRFQKGSSEQMSLGALGTGIVVKLDGGRRLRLDDKVDFWPGTGRWQVLQSGEEHEGVSEMLAFLVKEREREGNPISSPEPLASKLRVLCDHCGMPAQLHLGKDVYPGRQDLAERHFWVCWPCDAWVGTHSNDSEHRPLGGLAKEELRDARRAAHEAFDPIWQKGLMTKSSAYGWLSRSTGIPEFRCHIGLLDLDECRVVTSTATAFMFDPGQ